MRNVIWKNAKKNFKALVSFAICLALMVSTFVVVPSTGYAADFTTASNNAYTWLKYMQDQTGNGLVDSFQDYWSANNPKQIAYTYDQAVAAIAFLVKGDITRGKAVLDKMKAMQDPAGFWINSYWYNNGAGEEIRRHVGPVIWMAMAVMNYEKITGDKTTYHDMGVKAVDWCLTFQTPANGAITGGDTQWAVPNTWTKEPWSSTEHNEDCYQTLLYFASTTPAKASTYNAAAAKVKGFLDNTVWDDTKKRFYGGFKNDTGLIDPNVPLDVNPWGVLALGLSGTRNYSASLAYVENANGNPGTLANPKYVHTLTYNDAGNTMTAYDFDWQSDNAAGDAASGGGVRGADIWFEGSAFMSCAYYMAGNTTKADSIITELIKKQGTSGAELGGVPYCLKGTNNNYWVMAQQNCVSSTGWLILAIHRWNPFTGTKIGSTTTPAPSATPTKTPTPGPSTTPTRTPTPAPTTTPSNTFPVTTWNLYNTAVSGVTPAGQNLQTTPGALSGWQPIKNLTSTASYWYAPTQTGTYKAGNWTFTLWTNSPGSSSNVKVELFKVSSTGASATAIGTAQTLDVNASGLGNHPTTFTFSGVAAQTLSNQRLMVKITKTTGTATVTMCYNGNDFPTRLVTP